MSKYRNQKVVFGNLKFDSKKERDRYVDLVLLETLDVISNLECQVKIALRCGGVDVKSKSGRRLSYRADFAYFEDGKRVFEDVKGYDTPLSSLKVAMVEAEYGYEIRIVR